eukprot:g211.t1
MKVVDGARTRACRYKKDDDGEILLELADGTSTSLTKDAFGGTEKNTLVMMSWEKKYMQACVDALTIKDRSDDVLEIGFGCGFSASRIQEYRPRTHTIIECDEVVLKRLRLWVKRSGAKNVKIVGARWQVALSGELNRERFDKIFFDDFPLPEDEGHLRNNRERRLLRQSREAAELLGSRWHVFLNGALPLLRKGGEVTGYMAEPLVWKRKDISFASTLFPVTVPNHCVYAKGKKFMYIPLFKNTRETREYEKDGDQDLAKRPKRRRRERFHASVLAQLGMD